jgi:ribosomal protein L7/L12
VNTQSEFEELAKLPTESAEDLNAYLVELRSRGMNIIGCIRYVRLCRECGLSEAASLVANSPAWADQREDFWHQQQEAFEEFLPAHSGRIGEIHQTFSPDGTETAVHLKPPVEPNAEPDPAGK